MLPQNGVSGNNRFAIDLYSVLQHSSDISNSIFSPFSISSAMGMTYAGAAGSTYEQMRNVMHFDTGMNTPIAFSTLNHPYLNPNSPVKIANKIWVAKGAIIKPKFSEIVRDYYNSGVERASFVLPDSCKKATNDINEWVEQKTNRLIKNLIPQGELDASTRMVLVNAIHFKGDWKYSFDSTKTHKEPFNSADGKKDSVKMMHMTSYQRYYETRTYKAIELPYKDSQHMSMVILLPNENYSLKTVEDSLNEGFINRLSKSLSYSYHNTILTLPKFTIGSYYKLKSEMIKLGLTIPFTNAANFSGILKDESLKISEIIHKAFIMVNEKGTEAAAATAVIMARTTTSMEHRPDTTKIFKADQPFIFYLKDTTTGSILFMGKVQKL
ncbi:MAG: serpin family protein [Bacteroidota bacterium]